MKKILLLIGIFVLALSGEKVYAYIQDCPRGVQEKNVNISQPRKENRNYGNAYYHDEYHVGCNCQYCSKVNNSEYQHHKSSHHNDRHYGNYSHHHS